MQKAKYLLPARKVDFITILIVLFFLGLTFVVFLYYKHRISEIQDQMKQSHNNSMLKDRKTPLPRTYQVTLIK